MRKGKGKNNYNDEIAAIEKAVEKADDDALRRALEESNKQKKLAPLLLTPRTNTAFGSILSERAIDGQEEALQKYQYLKSVGKQNENNSRRSLSPIAANNSNLTRLTESAKRTGITLPPLYLQVNPSDADEFGFTPRTAATIKLLVSPRAIAGQEKALKEIKNAPKKAHTLSPLFLPKTELGFTQSDADEFGFTPRTTADQIARLQQFEQHGPKFVDIVEDEAYLSLVAKCQADPFMIMGYQNGHPNLYYESDWKIKKERTLFIGRIYIPREENLNDRKYTRYPNQLMSNTDGKTIVNLSLHNWAFGMHYWHDKINNNYPEMNRNIIIQMSNPNGISEVESNGGPKTDFFSISTALKSISYSVHGSSYSPDTGVLALDDNKRNCICQIMIENGPTLRLSFYRDKDDYKINTRGGTRKRRRQTKRRQTKRRQTKRRQRL